MKVSLKRYACFEKKTILSCIVINIKDELKVQFIIMNLFNYPIELSYNEDEGSSKSARYNKVLAIRESKLCSFIQYGNNIMYKNLI